MEVEICFQLAKPDRFGALTMIVCLCKGVSSSTIDAEVERGAKTVGGVAKACQAGTGCGMCVGQIRDLIRLRTGDASDDAAPDGMA